jgi:thiamine transport system permease protein
MAIRSAAFFVCIMMAFPVLALLLRSIEQSGRITISHWSRALESSGQGAQLSSALWSSLRIALVATVIAVSVGLAAACAAAYSRSSILRRSVSLIASLPVVVSAVILGLGFVLTFRSRPVDWRGSWWLLPIAHSATALPFVVRSLTPAISAIPGSLRDAASVLGATPFRMWRDIDLAILKRPLAVAASLTAAISLGEFGATSLLSRRGSETLTTSLSRLLGRPGTSLQGQAFVVASVLALLSIIITLTADRFFTSNKRTL